MPYQVYLDTEFIQYKNKIELVSIGLVKDSGESYYAISKDFDAKQASAWVQQHVLATLESDLPRKSTPQIALEIPLFIGNRVAEFWGMLATHDWWLFLQMYQGDIQQLPFNLPIYCKELQQEIDRLHFPQDLLPQRPAKHHALADAQWNRDAHIILQSFEKNLTKKPTIKPF